MVVALDVTERRRMEEALRESEATLKILVDNAPFGIAQTCWTRIALRRSIRHCSKFSADTAFRKRWQLDPSTQIYSDIKDRDSLIEVLRRSGKVKGWETTLKRRNGTSDSGAAHRLSDTCRRRQA